MNTCKNQKIVRTIYADLNGDGNKEKVVLAGVPVGKDDNYMESLELIIELKPNDKKIFKLHESGGEFNIFSVNVTPLQGEEILLIGNYNKQGSLETIKILKYENESIKVLFDSKTYSKSIKYNTRYLDDYNIEIICENTQEKYTLDISGIYINYIANKYGSFGKSAYDRKDIIHTIDNIFPVKLSNNDYYSLIIQEGFRLEGYTEKLGGIHTLVDINDLEDITILDQYLIKML